MALDYLPAQASSVPSERVFSSSAETDTRRRNRITPDLMEKLQMLKFMLKKARLNFTGGLKCDELSLETENDGEDGRAQMLDSGARGWGMGCGHDSADNTNSDNDESLSDFDG